MFKDNLINSELKNELLNTSLAKTLDPTEIDILVLHIKLVSFSPGEMILIQGKKSEGIYIIIDGKALVTAKILGEGGTYIATLGRGSFLGEISIIEKGPCATSVIASTAVRCLFIPRIYFDTLSFFFPETKYKIIKAITKEVVVRLQDLHHKIANFISRADMATRSKIGGFIQSFTKPENISFEEVFDFEKKELQELSLFAAFTKEELAVFIEHVNVITLPKHTTLIQEGEKDFSCYIVLRGALKTTITQQNKVAKLSVLGPMSLFTTLNLIDKNSPAIINYTTCERTILLKINEANLNFLQTNMPEFWYKFFDLICESFVNLEKAADKLDIRLNSEVYNR